MLRQTLTFYQANIILLACRSESRSNFRLHVSANIWTRIPDLPADQNKLNKLNIRKISVARVQFVPAAAKTRINTLFKN